MPKPKKGPRLGGSPAHQRLILANLAKSLIIHESIVTTEAKARALRPYVEKMITKARKADVYNRNLVARKLGSKTPKTERMLAGSDAVYILFHDLNKRIDPAREGGYTRIVKLPPRKGDNAPMARISLVLEKVEKKAVVKKAEADTKAAAKKETEAQAEVAEELNKEAAAVDAAEGAETVAAEEKAE